MPPEIQDKSKNKSNKFLRLAHFGQYLKDIGPSSARLRKLIPATRNIVPMAKSSQKYIKRRVSEVIFMIVEPMMDVDEAQKWELLTTLYFVLSMIVVVLVIYWAYGLGYWSWL